MKRRVQQLLVRASGGEQLPKHDRSVSSTKICCCNKVFQAAQTLSDAPLIFLFPSKKGTFTLTTNIHRLMISDSYCLGASFLHTQTQHWKTVYWWTNSSLNHFPGIGDWSFCGKRSQKIMSCGLKNIGRPPSESISFVAAIVADMMWTYSRLQRSLCVIGHLQKATPGAHES